jgi:hypothetical protein
MNSTTRAPSPEEEGMRSAPGPSAPGIPGSDATATAAEDAIPADTLFHLLQNSRRRAVLRYLSGREGSVRMRDVAEQVAAWEHDTTVDRLTSEERQRVYITLYQSHLETLAEAGVIRYDKPRGVIEPRPSLDYVASYVDAGRPASTGGATGGDGGKDHGDSDRDGDGGRRRHDGEVWGRRYLGVAAIGTLLLVGTALDIAVFEAVSAFSAGVVILAMFSALTVVRLALARSGPTDEDQ